MTVEYYIRKSPKAKPVGTYETSEQAQKALKESGLAEKGYAVYYSKDAVKLYEERQRELS